jgi:HNH endonuclease
MPSAKAQRRRRLQFVESAMAAGACVGLVLALDAPGSAAPCRGGVGDCVSQSLLATAEPYLVHAALGAAAGLVVAFALIELWRWRSAPHVAQPARREPIPERVRHEVWRRDRGTCVECGSRGRLEFDHIIPVSRGGSNTTRNIELRCEPCNRRKGARI